MRLLQFIFFFMLVLRGYAQSDTLNYKNYKNHPKLTWNDFLVRPASDYTSKFAASVSTGLDFKWDYNIENAQQNFTYKVNACLYTSSSWVFEHKKDSMLLAHEQGHYDITELHARKLRMLISGYKLGRNIRKDLKVIYKNVESSRYKMQSAYDVETIHSKDREQQLLWEAKIDSLLQEYKIYK